MCETTLKQMEPRLGPDHRETLNCRNTLANALRAIGRGDEGLAQLKAILELQQV